MKVVGGFKTDVGQLLSYNDFPGEQCVLLHTTKCNFRCSYCFNLVTIRESEHCDFKWLMDNRIVPYFNNHEYLPRNMCISGGEISQEDLKDVLECILYAQSYGFKVKIDTNLSDLNFVFCLLDIVDYIAIDVKVPLNLFINNFGTELIKKYISPLEGVDYTVYKNKFSNLIDHINQYKSPDCFNKLIFRTTVFKPIFPTLDSLADHIQHFDYIVLDSIRFMDNIKIPYYLTEAIWTKHNLDIREDLYGLEYDLKDIINHENLGMAKNLAVTVA
jgi:organic radical activating enzyme